MIQRHSAFRSSGEQQNVRITFPRDFQDLTPGWLTAALADSGVLGAGRVVDVHRTDAAGGLAVVGQVARLLLRTEDAPADAPRSLVVKLPREGWLGKTTSYAREARFYRELAPRGGFQPRNYLARHDPVTDRFVLLMEDLTDAHPGHRTDGWHEAEAQAALIALARFQAAWWQSPRLIELEWPRATHTLELASSKVERFRRAWPVLTASDLYEVPAGLEESVAALLPGLPAQLTALGSPPFTLCHGDLHTQNLIFDDRSGEIVATAIDWQDCHLAGPAHDVANVISRNLTRETLVGHALPLLERYHEELLSLGVSGYSWGRLLRDWRLASLSLFLDCSAWLADYESRTEDDRRMLYREQDRLTRAVEYILEGNQLSR